MTGAGALAGAEHGKFALSPITPADAATPPRLSEQKWWPSKWGADHQVGASNHITPEKVLDAAKWIKDGKIYKLGHNYEAGMPLFGKRALRSESPAARPEAPSDLVWWQGPLRGEHERVLGRPRRRSLTTIR